MKLSRVIGGIIPLAALCAGSSLLEAQNVVTVVSADEGGISGLANSLTIDLPELSLQPNASNQSFDINVQNDGAPLLVNGIGFNIQVADGGPDLPAPLTGTIDGPEISGLDILTGTAFSSNNTGQRDTPAPAGGQFFLGETTTGSGTVSIPSGSSKIGSVTFDTTGFLTGTFALTMTTVNGPFKYETTGGTEFPTLVNGSLTIVPEPGETVAFAVGCLGLFVMLRRYVKAAASQGAA